MKMDDVISQPWIESVLAHRGSAAFASASGRCFLFYEARASQRQVAVIAPRITHDLLLQMARAAIADGAMECDIQSVVDDVFAGMSA